MLEEAIMSARETAELLLLVGRLVQAEGYDGELSPAQWMALRFAHHFMVGSFFFYDFIQHPFLLGSRLKPQTWEELLIGSF
jgi:hypothetical protein